MSTQYLSSSISYSYRRRVKRPYKLPQEYLIEGAY